MAIPLKYNTQGKIWENKNQIGKVLPEMTMQIFIKIRT